MSCQIVIDTPGPFYSGTLIQGRLICTFNGNQKIRGIKLRAYGDEHTEWWGTESYYNYTEKRHETRSVLLTGDNNLFGLEQMLYGGNGSDIHIGPGTFNYPFSFQLPDNLPSTFENSNGYIRYTIKGVIDVPWGLDYEDKLHFVVISLIDLNKFPLESFQPVSRSDQKTICCWCCAGGDITIDINIAKTAFVPGESVKLYMSVTNMSNSNVDEIEGKLTQFIKSKVETPQYETREDENILSSNTWSGVGAHGENNLNIELPIPEDILVPNLDRSSLFEVYYDVQITAAIGGCHTDIDLSFSVNLGHIQNNTQMGGGYATPPNIQPQQAGTGYPYPGGGNVPGSGYPAPFTNAGPPLPYPSGAPYPPGPSAPTVPAPYSSDVPSYTSVASGGNSEKSNYFSNPSVPQQGYNSNLNEKNLGGEGGSPSAPPSELPPPSYDDIIKKN